MKKKKKRVFLSSPQKFCEVGPNEERFQPRKEAVQEAIYHKNWNICNESADRAFAFMESG